MAFSKFMAFLAILVVLLFPMSATSIFNPFGDNICDNVECGKGSCQVANGSPFNFKCVCDSNWKRTRLDNETDLEFLPCIFPNCSLNYSCMPATPPLPAVPYNLSFFDPCYWMYCGQGTCTKNATYTRTCQCNPGYSNLLGIPVYPCYSDCALGSDCGRLGVKLSSSTSSTPSSNSNQATSVLPGKFHWIAALSLISVVMLLWK